MCLSAELGIHDAGPYIYNSVLPSDSTLSSHDFLLVGFGGTTVATSPLPSLIPLPSLAKSSSSQYQS